MRKQGILLVNLGSPDQPAAPEVKVYLERFLSDPRVIKTPRAIWLPILKGVILKKRPAKSAALYQQIWQPEGSPLMIYGRAQQRLLQARFPDAYVGLAMSYSDPLIPDVLTEMLAQGVTDLTVIPLYPQYSGTTVGSIFDEVISFFHKTDRIVDLHFIRSFYDEPHYLDYFANKLKARLAQERFDAILFSYHGIPVAYVKDGDHYPEECQATTAGIMARVGDFPYFQTFQSRFGPDEWLTPATDATLKALPAQGVKKILVVAPGFIADCLETIHEIEVENREYFLSSGGEKFTYLPTFNDDPALTEVLAALLRS
ncbi:ferrochelatase [Lapidilactobacillus luobeiensis]|uniref:ferrochelatase n=1 Tax=Lapidilactobacillus luobeiensis TaxID=2950371 RepID=UPI0021C26600|nr:ferrochelatase [Lapidilactobacillus luobeiensis]